MLRVDAPLPTPVYKTFGFGTFRVLYKTFFPARPLLRFCIRPFFSDPGFCLICRIRPFCNFGSLTVNCGARPDRQGRIEQKSNAKICGARSDRQGIQSKKKARICGARPDQQGRLGRKLRLGFVVPGLIERAELSKNPRLKSVVPGLIDRAPRAGPPLPNKTFLVICIRPFSRPGDFYLFV